MFNTTINFASGASQKDPQEGLSVFRALDLPFTVSPAGAVKIIAKKGFITSNIESTPTLFVYEGTSPIPANLMASLPSQANVVFQIFKDNQIYGEYQICSKQNFDG